MNLVDRMPKGGEKPRVGDLVYVRMDVYEKFAAPYSCLTEDSEDFLTECGNVSPPCVPGVVREMLDFRGKAAAVTYVHKNGSVRLDADNGRYAWTRDMLAGYGGGVLRCPMDRKKNFDYSSTDDPNYESPF